MAVGTVSGITPEDNWQLIATTSAAGTSSVTFNSFSGYKKLLLTVRGITKSGSSSYLGVQLNGDTASGNYASSVIEGTANQFIAGYDTAGASASYFWIENVDQSVPHKVSGINWSTTVGDGGERYYLNPVPITSLRLFNWQSTSAPWTGGTIQLWGIPA